MPENHDDVLDHALLADLLALDPENGVAIIDELLEAFQSLLPTRLKRIRESIETGNHQVLSDEAHQLKSSGGNLGAKHVFRICQHLETLADSGKSTEARPQLDQLESELTRAIDALRAKKYLIKGTF